MIQKFAIPGRLPGYNELHRTWQVSRRIKQDAMDLVMWSAKTRLRPVKGRCVVRISCYEPNARRDVDNVTSGASKVILDALQQIGVLAGDGRKYVKQVELPAPEVDRKNPRVEVEIREEDDE